MSGSATPSKHRTAAPKRIHVEHRGQRPEHRRSSKPTACAGTSRQENDAASSVKFRSISPTIPVTASSGGDARPGSSHGEVHVPGDGRMPQKWKRHPVQASDSSTKAHPRRTQRSASRTPAIKQTHCMRRHVKTRKRCCKFCEVSFDQSDNPCDGIIRRGRQAGSFSRQNPRSR